MLSFEVYGVPIPKGSTRAFIPKGWSRAIVTADNKRTKPWQAAIVEAARVALGNATNWSGSWRPIDTAVVLSLQFFLPRPRSAPRAVTVPAKKPDLDKLIRSAKDGLTQAGAYTDDALVVEVHAAKHFAGGENDPAGPAGLPRAVIGIELREPSFLPAGALPLEPVVREVARG